MNTLKLTLLAFVNILITSCVQDTHLKTVFVSVNMNSETSHSQVGIRGNYPLSWDETTLLTDDNNDGIYEGKFEFYTANNAIQFKFVNHNNQFELDGQANRTLEFEYKPETIHYNTSFNNLETTIKKH